MFLRDNYSFSSAPTLQIAGPQHRTPHNVASDVRMLLMFDGSNVSLLVVWACDTLACDILVIC